MLPLRIAVELEAMVFLDSMSRFVDYCQLFAPSYVRSAQSLFCHSRLRFEISFSRFPKESTFFSSEIPYSGLTFPDEAFKLSTRQTFRQVLLVTF